MFSVLANRKKIAYGQKDFILDFETDITELPTDCEVGSTAFVIESSKTYMLNHQKHWVKVNLSSGSGGGTGGGDDTEEIIYNGGTV